MKHLILVLASLIVLTTPARGADSSAEQRLQWPRESSYADGARLILYQPQVEDWTERPDAPSGVFKVTDEDVES